MRKDKPAGAIIHADKSAYRHRLMLGIPTTGVVRFEWVMARYNQTIPCNWSQVDMPFFYASWSPIGYQVADARNVVATQAIKDNFEWLLFIDHDTMPPPNTLIALNNYMIKRDIPVVCGLYFTKSVPADPLIYRGLGNGSFRDWKWGDKVWVDGIPMGCTLIHVEILKSMINDCEKYKVRDLNGNEINLIRFFITPAESKFNEETGAWENTTGTEDLNWCHRVIKGGYLKKAGWPKIGAKKYPFLIDTNLFCKHIDLDGVQYPSRGEEGEFARKAKKIIKEK
jgi:hypothetical protein